VNWLIRKVWAAIVRVRSWPHQIEADLARYYHLDIADWHTGVMTSRRLLALLEQLPDDSVYKTAFERDGQWPVWMQMLKTVANETSMHRASLYAGGDNAYDVQVFVDPIEQKQRLQEALEEHQFHQEATSELYEKIGWT
jgi:hypothetical protein